MIKLLIDSNYPNRKLNRKLFRILRGELLIMDRDYLMNPLDIGIHGRSKRLLTNSKMESLSIGSIPSEFFDEE